MSGVISLMRVFTWAAAPVAGLVSAICLTVLTSKRHYGDNPPAEADHEIRNSPKTAAVWVVVSGIMCLFALVAGLIVLQHDNEAVLDSQAIQVNVTGQQWAGTLTMQMVLAVKIFIFQLISQLFSILLAWM
jgi:cytochrome c oxidase subunit 2